MTEAEVHAAADRLDGFFRRFAPLFGKVEAQRHAFNYVKGLMVCGGRRSIEPIARSVGEGRVSGLQKFINIAPWRHDAVQAEIQAVFGERLGVTSLPPADGVGVVGVIEELGFAKKGQASVGVCRQHHARAERTENCQVGLFLVGVAPGGMAGLDHRLYLPPSWCDVTKEGRARRTSVHAPEHGPFPGRAEIAAGLVGTVANLGLVHLDWVVSREPYAAEVAFLDDLERLEQHYLMQVPGTTLVAQPDAPATGPADWSATLNHVPATRWTVADLCERWPGPWTPRRGPGAGSEWMAVRVRPERHLAPGPTSWLLMQRPSGSPAPGAATFHLSNADPGTAPDVFPRVLEAKDRAASYCDETLGLLGQGHYETRSWIGWHHHMSLVALAHLAVTLAGQDARREEGTGAPAAFTP